MAYQNASCQRYSTQSTRRQTESVWQTAFKELKQFVHHSLGFGNSLREAASHLRAMLDSGRTLWGLVAQYLL